MSTRSGEWSCVLVKGNLKSEEKREGESEEGWCAVVACRRPIEYMPRVRRLGGGPCGVQKLSA